MDTGPCTAPLWAMMTAPVPSLLSERGECEEGGGGVGGGGGAYGLKGAWVVRAIGSSKGE